jgi:hypothetical protein
VQEKRAGTGSAKAAAAAGDTSFHVPEDSFTVPEGKPTA